MLVLNPTSRCDVCLEGYHGLKEPLVITCGHIFCQSCLVKLPKSLCPLCRIPFQPADVRKLHVDRTAVPPTTPSITGGELDPSATTARRFQSCISQIVHEGAQTDELQLLFNNVRSFLSGQPAGEFTDLRATVLLLHRHVDLQGKWRSAVDVEQTLKNQLEEERRDHSTKLEEELHRSDELNAKLVEEREAAAAKYDELLKRSFDEREVLLAAEAALKSENERLQNECDEWRAKLDEASNECCRLSEELEKAKRSPRYFYLHDLSGAKAEKLAVYKEEGTDASSTTSGKDAFFHLSPVPLNQIIPELPPNLTNFAPLTDDIDDLIDDDRDRASNSASISSASRSIPIKSRSDSHRTRSNSSSLLSRPDGDAMSISVPRSVLDIHMSGCSTSPTAAPIKYGPRPTEFLPPSVGRVPENALGLRADPSLGLDLDHREQQERRERLAQLRDVLQDPYSSTSTKPSRKPSLSDDRSRSAFPSGISSTRTPSPPTNTPPSEKDYSSPYRHQVLGVPTAISVASTAAAERERARASSVNSLNAPSGTPIPPTIPPTPANPTPAPAMSSSLLSHIAVARDSPLHSLYPSQVQGQPRPLQSRRDSASSASSGSISKGKASTMGFQSGLTRSMRAQMEMPRVS